MSKYFKDPHDCIHAWAQQLYDAGHSNHLFFKGNTIYSYGPIAYLDSNRVLLSLHSHTGITAKHIQIIRSAICDKKIVWVHCLELAEGALLENDSAFHRSNIDYWTGKLSELFDRFRTFPNNKSLLAEIQTILFQVKSFITEVKITPPEKLHTFLANPTSKNLQKYFRQQDNKKQSREKLQQQQQQQLDKDVQEWESGAKESLLLQASRFAYLRINGNRIESSKGAKISVREAKEFWDFLSRKNHVNIPNYKYTIHDFEVDEITADYIKISCHTIPLSEVYKIARQLRW